jgi:bifunctional DNA-binding transcriptional regulator/antitoxin component of YhaV-PrlF toxin-antitoxin module
MWCGLLRIQDFPQKMSVFRYEAEPGLILVDIRGDDSCPRLKASPKRLPYFNETMKGKPKLAIQTLKLTAKRQATFPAEFCSRYNLHPGDRLILDRREIDGEATWTLKPVASVRTPWFGVLRKYGTEKSHSMDEIRTFDRDFAKLDNVSLLS